MFDVRKIDINNTYEPDLKNIKIAAERTYNSANIYLKMAEKEINDLLNGELEEVVVYDSANAIATILSLASELYLKSIYILEVNKSEIEIDKIWNDLKTSTFKVDKMGNPIYLLKKPNGEEVYTYLKLDEEGNKILDSQGKNVYVDAFHNEYSDGTQGKKIRLSGHQLDRLIEILNDDTRVLLELRVLRIPMDTTEMYNKISIYDYLKTKKIIFGTNFMNNQEYNSWIEQHKKTFEQTRYSGQNISHINLEFLYHLTKQIQVIANYKINSNINPLENIELDNLDINTLNIILKIKNDFLIDLNNIIRIDANSDDEYHLITESELNDMPNELKYLCQFVNFRYMSKNLIDHIKNDSIFKEKLNYIINNNYRNILREINSNMLYKFIKFFDIEDIKYLCQLFNNSILVLETNREYISNTNIEYQIAKAFRMLNFSFDDIINYLAFLKTKYNCQINNNIFNDFISFMELNNLYYYLLDDSISKEANSRNLK